MVRTIVIVYSYQDEPGVLFHHVETVDDAIRQFQMSVSSDVKAFQVYELKAREYLGPALDLIGKYVFGEPLRSYRKEY